MLLCINRFLNKLSAHLPAAVSFTYDANGNLTEDGRRVFEYDYENQLTNVYVASAWRESMKYDAFGRKRVLQQRHWTGSAWLLTNEVRYVYDGMLVIQERHFQPQVSTNIPINTISYTRGNDLSGSLQGAGGIGGLLARTDSSSIQNPASSPHAYYHADGNGNITALVNTNGAVVARYQYDPYGNLLGMAGPLAEANVYRFSSKEWHANAGLYYYGFRFYEPNLQRWLNRDLIGEEGGINLFAFVVNNPIEMIDPEGLCSWEEWNSARVAADKAWEKYNVLRWEQRHLEQRLARIPQDARQIGSSKGASTLRHLSNVIKRHELTARLNQVRTALPDAHKAALDAAAKLARLKNAYAAAQVGRLGTGSRAGLIGLSFTGGFIGGRFVGNIEVTPESGVTVDDGMHDLFLPFWNWCYGVEE